MSGIFFTY
jgi:hypothetical protein